MSNSRKVQNLHDPGARVRCENMLSLKTILLHTSDIARRSNVFCIHFPSFWLTFELRRRDVQCFFTYVAEWMCSEKTNTSYYPRGKRCTTVGLWHCPINISSMFLFLGHPCEAEKTIIATEYHSSRNVLSLGSLRIAFFKAKSIRNITNTKLGTSNLSADNVQPASDFRQYVHLWVQ